MIEQLLAWVPLILMKYKKNLRKLGDGKCARDVSNEEY